MKSCSRQMFQHSSLVTLLLFLVCILAPTATAASHKKVRLTNIQALTLHAGRMTTARRSSPVKQLSCVNSGNSGFFSSSKSACSDTALLPQTVQCINKGTDGVDVQWACTAELDSTVKFGSEMVVACEGWAYPEDPFVLAGSCGLEYTLVRTALYDRTRPSKEHHRFGEKWKPSWSFWKSKEHYYTENTDGSSWIGFIIWTAVFAFIAYRISLACCSKPRRQGNHRTTETRGTFHSTAHAGTSFDPNSGPPPPYNDGWESQDNTHQHASAPHPGAYPSSGGGNSQNSDGSRSNNDGFWSGFTSGSILGSLFGNRSYWYPSTNYFGYGPQAYPSYTFYPPRPTSWWSWGSGWPQSTYTYSNPMFRRTSSSSGSRSQSPAPSTRTSTTYGGTRRR
ncbi:hypothetical protein BATDEDRAFT_36625 [Batrachochytrium dendrobatidis JAM81]|uniref:Store-operated calcium entry-associated regulatory factor n=2 Tax=Batrachochytrium dendrobatidis TaxID=109871 RepID=F4NW76_BATDJ|nr:uncharacterized protein BATDEDRAFT_36625 [Batrachochytrium dendrobatidis JAM81]EGF82781.1 hypothetical protein BATDEDRAFT_36625 [Batrachochytrium dendrobatidis JAM81]OAJ39666.1 hypothetical protein BDEG_23496 [Batrachochytrium dendrobatidis JEL423]|eukprot:XP_006676849.1 hypothetical protein BATDEDRAFT_36625 [Batrachochytrium dendrobatidis JAM81]